jgi:S-adenosylmethionine synthetase
MHRRYGPTSSNAESAVNILIDVVRDQSGKKYTMDHYQTRFPTNVLDVASFLVRLASMNHLFLLFSP